MPRSPLLPVPTGWCRQRRRPPIRRGTPSTRPAGAPPPRWRRPPLRPPSRPTSTPRPAEAFLRNARAVGGSSGGRLDLVEALGERVPAEGVALDANRELDHALQLSLIHISEPTRR